MFDKHTVAQTSTLTPTTSFSDKINQLIDASLQANHAQAPKRDYLGASRLGVSCSRALQYEYTNTPRDQPWSGKTLRIFAMGHALEKMAWQWLSDAGFEISTTGLNNQPHGFATADGRIQGHIDGIIHKCPQYDNLTEVLTNSGQRQMDVDIGIGDMGTIMTCPALWECKSMNAKSWKQTVTHGVSKAHPSYAVQIALYQAYMGLNKNPALFTAINKDTSEIYHELVVFDAALAQQASDRGVNILLATNAGETLPRVTSDPNDFACRFCDWQKHCWQENG
jgi:hypothetical protein